jgi:hypothetical protein
VRVYNWKEGRKRVNEACLWIKTHKHEFLTLQEICLQIETKRDSHGRHVYHSIMRGSVYLQAEQMHMQITDTKLFKRNNNLWSTISRYLTLYHPELNRVIRHRNQSDVGAYVGRFGLPKLHYTYRLKTNKNKAA